MSARVRRAGMAVLLASALVGSAGPAFADPSPEPFASTRSAPGDGDPAPLSPEQVRDQVAQANRLQKQLTAANAAVADASTKLAALSAASGRAMDAVVTARRAEAAARKREQAELGRLATLAKQAAAARSDVSRMAYDAYVNGAGSLRDLAAVVALGSRGDAAAQASTVDYLAGARAADGRHYTSLAQAQQVAARRAVEARQARESARARAEAAQARVTASLEAQQKALAELQATARGASERLEKLGVSSGLGTHVDLAKLGELTTRPLCSDDTGDYANGMLPAGALCPIDGAPGHMMRPAAARALNALKAAYADDLGRPLCITDTYRSFAAQVDVKRRKPTLAATPGQSNHGLGLATDLCGGIESFGTCEHQWMQQHAPLFGFFHPAWAEPGGSKPEPWHWEYAQ